MKIQSSDNSSMSDVLNRIHPSLRNFLYFSKFNSLKFLEGNLNQQ